MGQLGPEQALAHRKGIWIPPGLITRPEGAQEDLSIALAMQMAVLCGEEVTTLSSCPGELQIWGAGYVCHF